MNGAGVVLRMKTILAPIDFSAVTPWLVAEAAELARALNARLVLLNVSRPASLAADQASFRETIEHLVENPLMPTASDQSDRRRSKKQPQVTGASRQLIGEPIPVILEQAGKLGADCIVIGSHGRSELYDFVFGSVAAGVLKHAKCPVVVVPSRRRQIRDHLKRTHGRSAPFVSGGRLWRRGFGHKRTRLLK